jgi:hypothetical protein
MMFFAVLLFYIYVMYNALKTLLATEQQMLFPHIATFLGAVKAPPTNTKPTKRLLEVK